MFSKQTVAATEFWEAFRDKISKKKKVNKPTLMHEHMSAVYGKRLPSYYQLKFWSKQFK